MVWTWLQPRPLPFRHRDRRAAAFGANDTPEPWRCTMPGSSEGGAGSEAAPGLVADLRTAADTL